MQRQMDDDRFSDLDPFVRDNTLEEAKLAAHENDPLDVPLNVKIQPLTMERLQEYCKENDHDIEDVVNAFIKSRLYDEGY